jgi:hypothetical protein
LSAQILAPHVLAQWVAAVWRPYWVLWASR